MFGSVAAGEDVTEGVPAECEDGEGEDHPCGAVGQGVKGTEGQANFSFSCGQRIADIHSRNWFNEERYQEV